jgi:hypothetical protein
MRVNLVPFKLDFSLSCNGSHMQPWAFHIESYVGEKHRAAARAENEN